MPRPASTAAARHLVTLKLYDAVEHLLAILDHAHAEGLSLTAALERLLAIEVDATEARRLAGRLRFTALPTPARLEDFDYDAAPGADAKLIAELATRGYLESAANALLIGPPGAAKRCSRWAWPRSAAETGNRTSFTTANDLAARCAAPRLRPLGHHYTMLLIYTLYINGRFDIQEPAQNANQPHPRRWANGRGGGVRGAHRC